MTHMAQRTDRAATPPGWTAAVRVDIGHRLRKAERTPSGGVRVPGAIVRAGVMEYELADGRIVRELVPLEEVANPDALRTLRDAPITVGHPSGMVTPETYRRDAVGHVSGEGRPEGDHAIADLVVLDSETIRALDTGELCELSPGYRCFIDPTPGVFEGQSYDAIQRMREYNHVALLPEGAARGGSSVALRFDGRDSSFAVQVRTDARHGSGEHAMSEIRIDGTSYGVAEVQSLLRRVKRLDEEVEKLEEEKKDIEEEKKDVEEEKEKADADLEAMKAERDTLKAAIAELEAKIAELEDPAAEDERADARARLKDSARAVLGADAKLVRADGKPMNAREIKAAVLAKIAPDVDTEKAADAYIDGRFDSEVARLGTPLTRALKSAYEPAASRSDSGVNPHTVGRKPPKNVI